MPLPSDQRVTQLANDLIAQFDTMFGQHPGLRPAHAKGVLLAGRFTPSSEAAELTRAPHIARDSTPITVRFSNSTGLPLLPDNDPNANPRGLAIRFHLAEHVHTDIIGHSVDGFPTRTPEEFLEFLRAAAASGPGTPSPSPVERFLGTHPAALAFVQTPKPGSASFAKEAYFGVTALRFINKDGAARYGRFRITPSAGIEYLNDTASKAKSANYLFDELAERVTRGAVRFAIHVQVAEEGDVVNDATVHWPESRRLVPFGTVALTEMIPDNEGQQRTIIFDPIPRVDGIEASADPLLELRAAAYLLSGRRRRQTPATRTA
jgi:catalase